MPVAFALSPPLPIATQARPTPRPATPGITARLMWPTMISTALKNNVRSEPSSRSATHDPSTVAR